MPLSIGLLMLLPMLVQGQISNTISDSVYNGWIRAYLVKSGTQTYFTYTLTDRRREYFWELAYLVTTAEDAYDGCPTAARKQNVQDLVSSFLAQEKSNWNWDLWMDDIDWVCNMFVRGYQITGDSTFLAPALTNWKTTWSRGWSPKYGGGIWELLSDTISGGKGGLSNWPFIFSGCLLYEYTGDTSILNKCITDYAWTRTHAYDPVSGRIYEQTGPNGMNGDDNSYNSGLLVNAAASLFKLTKDSLYFKDATTAAAHYIGRLGTSGIMTEDHPANGYFGCEQFARGLSKFAHQNYLWNKYWQFLSNNCAAAWSHRRTDYNFTWNNFSQNTPTGDARALEVEGSVAVQVATPVVQSITATAQDTIQAEDFNYMNGITVGINTAVGGSKFVGPVSTGNILEYIIKVPQTGVYTITYRVAGTSDGSVVFQLNGLPLATTVLPQTGTLQTYISVATTKVMLQAGIQSVKLLPQTGSWVLDWWSTESGDHTGVLSNSISNAGSPHKINVYSNPAMTKLTIDCGNQYIKNTAILDMSGRAIRQNTEETQGMRRIDVSSMPHGIYLLSIQTDKNERLVRKFIK